MLYIHLAAPVEGATRRPAAAKGGVFLIEGFGVGPPQIGQSVVLRTRVDPTMTGL